MTNHEPAAPGTLGTDETGLHCEYDNRHEVTVVFTSYRTWLAQCRECRRTPTTDKPLYKLTDDGLEIY